MQLLIAMMGLPRSGKSTKSKELSQRLAAPIVNGDAIRLALHGQRYEALAEPMVRAIKLIMIRALFGAGHQTVICDETNFSRSARDYIKSNEWTTQFYEITTSAKVCIERAIKTGQPDLIPIIDGMEGRYDPLDFDEEIYIPHSEHEMYYVD